MTSFEARIVLRPRSLDETFDLALAYLRGSARDFLRVFLLLTLIAMALIAALTHGLELGWWQRGGAAIIVVSILERVVTVYAGRHLFENAATLRACFLLVAKRALLVTAWALIAGGPFLLIAIDPEAPAFLGFGLFILTFWPFVIAPHLYAGEAALLEQLPVGRALRRSRALVLYRFGRALGMLLSQVLVRALFVVGAAFATSFLIEFVLQFEGVPESVTRWAAIGGYALSGPYLALVRLFDYVDARTRREGWDIQVRFNAIAQRAQKERANRLAA